MSRSVRTMGVCIALIAGVLTASCYSVPRLYVGLALALALLSGFSHRRLWPWAMFVLAFCVGVIRYQASIVPNELADWFGSTQRTEGIVRVEPDVRTDRQLLTVTPRGKQQKKLVTTSLATDVQYGDMVLLVGTPEAARSFEDFDYPRYLERYNIYALMRYPKVLVLKNHAANRLVEVLLKIKAGFVRRINTLLPVPENTLLLGILIGARKALPPEVVENFTAAGVSHVIAVSGYNISIIIAALEPLTRLIGRRWGTVCALILISCFVVISGGSSSVIRAAIMGALLLVSYMSGRLYAVGPALWLTAAVMVLVNPRVAYWDVGFQLSFVATVGIVYGIPLVSRYTEHLVNPFGLLSLLSTTLVALVVTAPLVAWQFGRLSIVAPLANILIVPLVPVTMLFGFLSVLPWIGAGFAWVTHWLLRYMLAVVAWSAHVPYASVQWHLAGGWALVWYGVLILLYAWLRYRHRRRLVI